MKPKTRIILSLLGLMLLLGSAITLFELYTKVYVIPFCLLGGTSAGFYFSYGFEKGKKGPDKWLPIIIGGGVVAIAVIGIIWTLRLP